MERILLPPQRVDLSGQTFGRLVVLYAVEAASNRQVVYACRCSCGRSTRVRSGNLVSGNTRSCGCLNDEALLAAVTKHGCYRTSLYGRWRTMVQRCENPQASGYAWYGGRDIAVCARWRHSFETFLADVGEPPPGLVLGRKDKQKDFTPDNVRWMTHKQSRGRAYLTGDHVHNPEITACSASTP